MRHPIGFFALFLAQPPRRTTSCSHCGDSFVGDLAVGRAWLREHTVSEHLQPAHRSARRRPVELRPSVRPRPAFAATPPLSAILMATPTATAPAVDPTK
jgi:hypothetical protein